MIGPMNDSSLEIKLTKSEQFELVQKVTRYFWEKWTVEVTPEWIIRYYQTGWNLKVGDIVLVHNKYTMVVVEAVMPSKDGLFRSYSIGYGVPNKTKLQLIVVSRDLLSYCLLRSKLNF